MEHICKVCAHSAWTLHCCQQAEHVHTGHTAIKLVRRRSNRWTVPLMLCSNRQSSTDRVFRAESEAGGIDGAMHASTAPGTGVLLEQEAERRQGQSTSSQDLSRDEDVSRGAAGVPTGWDHQLYGHGAAEAHLRGPSPYVPPGVRPKRSRYLKTSSAAGAAKSCNCLLHGAMCTTLAIHCFSQDRVSHLRDMCCSCR